MATSTGRKLYSRIPDIYSLPSLIQVQVDSFQWLLREGLAELFDEVSPIESYNGGMKLYFPGKSREAREFGLKFWFEDPKHDLEECVERDLTFARPLYVSVLLAGPEVPQPVKNEIFLGDFPIMTEKGTFIVNGTERVVVSQLIRSPGVYFEAGEDRLTGRRLAASKLIPDRGAWMEFETRKSDYLTLKFNRKRTVPVTILLRALAAVNDGIKQSPIKTGSDEELLELFAASDTNPDHPFIATTIRQEPTWEIKDKRTLPEEALIEFYRRMRPGDPPTLDNAREYLIDQLFDPRRYDLERVGRYKLNQKLDLHDIVPLEHRQVTAWDVVRLVERLIRINNHLADPDDIDHLGNRRVKTVGELIQAKLRVGLRRAERVIVERMSIRDQEQLTPITLVNIRPIVAAIREFFGSSQLSQFMDQTNPLAELRHKRTLSALGPGGLRRERAGFDVRDVHHSHYGRICPIETPEGPNIGLIGRLASYAKVNRFGFIETPYRKVIRELDASDPRLLGRKVRGQVMDAKGNKVLAEDGQEVTNQLAKSLGKAGGPIPIVPFVSEESMYLTADEEDKWVIAQANAPLNERQEFVRPRASSRHHGDFLFSTPVEIDYMDVAPRQIVGVSASLIPFLEHDDANRALMGSNMQTQAVPLIRQEVPLVSTGMERQAAIDSGQVILADVEGDVVSVTGSEVVVRHGKERRVYGLRKYNRSNQSTCIDQRPAVIKGQRVRRGDVIADSSSTALGELALGQNVLCAFLSWEGGNFEDAILISERLVQEDKFTSVHIEKHEVEARDTKLGPEEITYDIPNVGDEALRDLNEDGIIRVGAEVGPNDILVGKITPKGEKELTPEEKLLRAIFGEKAREVKDTSLRMPHGERGKVVEVKVFTREEHRDLPPGVEKMVRVSVAQKRKATEGDKMAGRHGNKGVISKVVPVEDMPFLADGTPIDLILNPLGVPGRMNIGQILEAHLGWAAERLGFRAVTPVFDGADEQEIEAELARAWMIDRAWQETAERAWAWAREKGFYQEEAFEDDAEVRRLYLESWLAGRNYAMDLIATDRNYARRANLREWLREKGYDPDTVLLFEDGRVESEARSRLDAGAVETCMRLWIEAHGESPKGKALEDLREQSEKILLTTGTPPPILGKQVLFDGKNGEPYDQPVTVGNVLMMKLHHLVEDKVHARSTGPYSLVTQQPLGGKAQFGGQRFGEMEVWALEAYGAAHSLQEMLTVKSDDVQGRVKTYEAIVKGDPVEEPGIPASFRVLVKELQSLGLSVEAVSDEGEILKFGKDDERARPPRLGLGLLDMDPRA
ncbi:MAG TPA: DNA-directed RNA polymerase subunit beta [Anaerolineales bacterium]|nr:DNA-directed RNA polymerase subunit beta [Anaerolineales bacterium]